MKMYRETKYCYYELGLRIIICLSLPCVFSHQLECDHRKKCTALQQDSKVDCCYLSAGDNCIDESRRICASDMGYRCVDGTCTGKYNLTVVRTDDTSMNLTWSPFLQLGARFNYTVLYSTLFHTDPLLYSSHTVENKNSYCLKWLTPDTWYFVQIGVWTGTMYENLTEVVMAQTKATNHCIYNGRRVEIGEQLVIDCEESCYCTLTGRFQCVPVCSRQQSSMAPCSSSAVVENCCDNIHQCSFDSCTYLGETVQHESSWVINCDENCTCYDGSVTCVPHCADVMIPDNCTNPVLTKSRDGCCDTYDCHEEERVCQYKNASYKVDTWFQSTDCEICRCMLSGKLSCVDLSKCMLSILPNQSEICPSPSRVDSHCCEQIICGKQTGDTDLLSLFTVTKYSMNSVLVRFRFTSTNDELGAVRMTLFYSTELIQRNLSGWKLNFTFNFKDIIDASNKTLEFRDFGKPFVLYKIKENYIVVVPRLTSNKFYYMRLKVEFDENIKVIHEYTSATMVVRLPGFKSDEANNLILRQDQVSFTVVNISSNSAFLSWTIPEPLLINISSFVVKYKPFRSSEWLFSERLIFSDRHFLLNCLYPTSWYEAQLIVHPGGRSLATTFFNTSAIKEISSSQLTLNIRNISIRTSSAIITWERLPESLATDVNHVEVLWTRGNDYDTLLIACVNVHEDFYKIQDLVSGKIYSVWLGVSRKDGTTSFTSRMHFVPLQKYETSQSRDEHSIVFAVTGTCLSLVAMSVAIVIVVYLLRYKRRASYQEHTSFENRIFQIYSNKDEVI